MRGSQGMNTVRVWYCKCIFHMHTSHNTQTTTNIRMHAWLASDSHRSSSQSKVYIPTYASKHHDIQTTIDIMLYTWFKRDAHSSVHYPSCIFPHTHTTLGITCYRHQDVCVIHRWCTLFESTMPVLYTYMKIHISPNTRNGTEIMVRTWLKGDAHCLISLLQVYVPTYTHNTQNATKSNFYRYPDAYMIHRWCTLFEFTLPSVHVTLTHTHTHHT